MKETVAKDHLHPRFGHLVRKCSSLFHVPAVHVEPGQLGAVEILKCQHAPRRVGPIHEGYAYVRVRLKIASEPLSIACLTSIVELAANRAGELIYQSDGIDKLKGLDALTGNLRRVIEQL